MKQPVLLQCGDLCTPLSTSSSRMLLVLLVAFFCCAACSAATNEPLHEPALRPDATETERLMQLPLRTLVKELGLTNFYLGTANHARLLDALSTQIADREFDYITPSNDFKQSYIHPVFNRWRWEMPDAYVAHAAKQGQVLRIHGPISPQCSPWAREDNRTADELSRMLDEYMTALCQRYNAAPNILWMDVVNETICPEVVKGGGEGFADKRPGDWFSPRQGTDKWENPWTIIGFDEASELNVPLYIDRAFELANRHAPRLKQIINQHGQFEAVVWEKMKELVHYLRTDKGRRVDGLGWQAHIDTGWEKIPGNLERLDAMIKWCHANNLEFHITEMNVWMKPADDPTMRAKAKSRAIIPPTEAAQADTFGAVLGVLLQNRKSGVVGLNFWNVRDEDTANPTWQGTLWRNDGSFRPAYMRIKQELIHHVNP